MVEYVEGYKVSLKSARINAELTLEEASNLIEVSSNTLSSWERGITSPPLIKLDKLCDTYNVGMNQLRFD